MKNFFCLNRVNKMSKNTENKKGFLVHTLWDVSTTLAFILFLFPALSYASNYPQISLSAISEIESSNNPIAIGDNGLALGLFQLHNCVITDYNLKHGTLYAHSEALEPRHAKKIANWYLHSQIPKMLVKSHLNANLDNVLTAWNMGIGNVKKGKVAKNYIKKYRKLIKKQAR